MHRVRQIAEIYGFLELPVEKRVSQIFTTFHFKQPGHFSRSYVKRKQPREDYRGVEGDCAMCSSCFDGDATLNSVKNLSHAEFPRRRRPSARSVQNDRLYYSNNMVLTISGLKPHVALAALAKLLYILAAFLQSLGTCGVNISFRSMVRPKRRFSPTKLICL
ncbi:hypothetical protein EVAR_26897_1 [Eumeta japonica]|uniref:Uncharacterized protein n=1 Tax=Eumeta variegata TaxID=151549 RepID=A0A4C1VVB6_EUMVA|nr:hypothetical protein EVAR_26897_1 [Eumeta japonica]